MATIHADLVLGPELAGTLMTPKEFDAVEECDEDYVYELIHGVLIVSPPPAESERGPNELLGYLLLAYLETHSKGTALDGTLPEQHVRTPNSRRRADRVIWAGFGRQPDPRRDRPSIVVEFVSPGKRSRRRDYEQKRDEYGALGIAEYWVIDRFARCMTVFRAAGSRSVVAADAVYRTPLLPGFELPLARLFAAADKWSRPAGNRLRLVRKSRRRS